MIDDNIYENYKTLLLNGNRAECSKIVKTLLETGIPIKNLFEQLFQKSLYDVGILWETNKISVAVEHLCTSITESLINQTYPYIFASENNGKKVIVTCTPQEFHQVGAKILADYFELNGWNSYFLGANTPYESLLDFIDLHQPDLLAVSMSVYFNLTSLLHLISNLNKKFPDLKIIVGGQGFNWGGSKAIESFNNVRVIKSLDDLDKRILTLQ